jgi:hypothetical protein
MAGALFAPFPCPSFLIGRSFTAKHVCVDAARIRAAKIAKIVRFCWVGKNHGRIFTVIYRGFCTPGQHGRVAASLRGCAAIAFANGWYAASTHEGRSRMRRHIRN